MNYKLRINRTKLEAPIKQAIGRLLVDPAIVGSFSKRKQIDVIRVLREYYTNSKELLPDSHYDEIEELVKKAQPRHKIWKEVGAPVQKGRIEIELPIYMPSMDKIKPGTPKLTKFCVPGVAYTIMDKLDGISLQLVYENGVPVQAATRGDGAIGQDISHWIPYMRIPKRIPIKSRFIVRAETIVATGTFDKKHDKTKTKKGKFKAARNMAGGVLNKMASSKDFKDYQKHMRDIDIVCYEIQEGKTAGGPISKQLAFLKRLKFHVVWHQRFPGIDQKNPGGALSAVYNQRIKNSPYEIDGIIVAKDIKYTAQRSHAKHARAFKENSEAAMEIVTVKSVDWEVSRNNTIVPTISIDPIRLGGVTVSNFLAHSLFYIQNGFKKSDAKLDLPVRPLNKGAKIKVVRSGGVIPYIVEVVKPARRPAEPPMEYKVKGVHAVVSGSSDTRKVKRLTHFFVSLGLDGFKASTFQKIFDAGYTTPKKIMNLKESQLAKIETFGSTTVKGLRKEIQRVLDKPSFVDFCVASGYMPAFGKDRVQKIVDEFGDIIFDWEFESKQHIVDQVQTVRGFKSLATEFASGLPKVFKLADNLEVELELPDQEQPTGSMFEDERITFTGVRDDSISDIIKREGGKVQSMKADTTLLIIKDESYTSSKVDKAEDKGIPVLTLAEFKKQYKL